MTLVGWLPEHSPHPLTTSSNTTATAPPTCANTTTTHLGQPACRGPPVPGRHLGGAKKKLVFRTPLLHRVRWDAAWGAGCGRAPARPSKKNLILVRRFCRRRFCRRRRWERTLALAFFLRTGRAGIERLPFFRAARRAFPSAPPALDREDAAANFAYMILLRLRLLESPRGVQK